MCIYIYVCVCLCVSVHIQINSIGHHWSLTNYWERETTTGLTIIKQAFIDSISCHQYCGNNHWNSFPIIPYHVTPMFLLFFLESPYGAVLLFYYVMSLWFPPFFPMMSLLFLDWFPSISPLFAYCFAMFPIISVSFSYYILPYYD